MTEGLGSPHSFVAFVGLDCHVVWSGRISARWTRAKALAVSPGGGGGKEEESEVFADGYKITLRRLGGEQIFYFSYSDKIFRFFFFRARNPPEFHLGFLN